MNFLQLCQRTRELSGISGTGPTTVVSQSGEMLRLVNWVASAWNDIQNISPYWNWMQRPFSFTSVANQQAYTLAEMGAPLMRRLDLKSLRCYVTAQGVATEEFIEYWQWDMFRDTYLYGVTQYGRPYMFAVDPIDKSVNLALTPPDTGYTIRGRYWLKPSVLAANTDTPEMPEEFHLLIVYRALLMYAGYANAPETKQEAAENYGRMLIALQLDQLPQITMGGALA